MKRNLFYTFMFSICFGIAAQTPTENYVKTTTYTAPSIGTITVLNLNTTQTPQVK